MNTDPSVERYSSSPTQQLLAQCLASSALHRLKFRSKYAIGPFVFDLVCPDKSLVIEIEGDHPGRSMAYDWERSQYLQRRGYRVLRLWGTDIEERPATVLEAIAAQVGINLQTTLLESQVA